MRSAESHISAPESLRKG